MAALSRWERVSRCLLAGLDDETIARACGIDIEDAALYRKQLDQGERVRMRKDVEINAMLRELGLSRAEAYYLLRTATKKDIDKIFRGGGQNDERDDEPDDMAGGPDQPGGGEPDAAGAPGGGGGQQRCVDGGD